MKKENIWNVPNFLTLSRVLIFFLIVYLVLNDYSLWDIIIVFVIGMLTDFFDGQIARYFHVETEFGAKFDIIADRILMIGTILVLIYSFTSKGILIGWYFFQIILILSREIISLPIVAWIIFSRKFVIPRVKFIGKLTTFIQAIAFPLILINMIYSHLQFSIYFSVITCIIGIISALTFIKDVRRSE